MSGFKSEKKEKFVNFALLVFLMGIQECWSQDAHQQLTLFEGKDGTGESLFLYETDEPDLNNRNFDNKANSVCVTGAWLFYEHANFNEVPAQMEYIYGNNSCVNFKKIGGKVSSFKLAGWAQDFQSSTISLYEGKYFQGEEEADFKNLNNLTLDARVSSLIITGLNVWTVYTEPDFKGDSMCIAPPKPYYTPAFVFDTKNVNVPANSIRSAQMGGQWCTENRKSTVIEPSTNLANNSTSTYLNTDTFAIKNGNNFTVHGYVVNSVVL